ncbi:hypothetical protein SLEP1_g28809 [Rubroshorea leprosula]|uniref:Uncharacterized protein n=1 Tax=Rubroshorea leprosula TaxID=152421 RepID=A0AAV5K1A3_9ROSI|nr:hypothetical protein SLEP1_g28809 [Rubroshorea leprosula]
MDEFRELASVLANFESAVTVYGHCSRYCSCTDDQHLMGIK